MRTLSARILLGFAALTITFGVITATLVVNTSQVENQVILIGRGYMPLALAAKDLQRNQEDLSVLIRDAVREPSRTKLPAEQTLKGLRLNRDNGVRKVREVLDQLETKIEISPAQFAVTRPRLEQIERQTAAVLSFHDEYYDRLKAMQADPRIDPRVAIGALAKLDAEERQLKSLANELASNLERSVASTAEKLEINERTLRLRTIYLGAIAVVLGLLVTVWVVVQLRPLRRLREGARRIAAGEYGSRVSEKGPAEVAELAREFNSMGRAIEERERELVRSERLAAVGKMAAMIAHEVRNPLSSIGLNTELLEDELGEVQGGDEARALCGAIHREVDRLSVITEEYLAFSRLPKPKLADERVNEMVDALATFVREDLAIKQVTLTTDLAAGDPIARIDAAQIRQCLLNLIRNASEAVVSKGEGHVTLRTRSAAEGRVEIDVEDNGIGIPADVLPQLFDPFFSTKEDGSGLGLALTQQIVRDHGGDLRVESLVGRGTTFTVSVPVGG